MHSGELRDTDLMVTFSLPVFTGSYAGQIFSLHSSQ